MISIEDISFVCFILYHIYSQKVHENLFGTIVLKYNTNTPHLLSEVYVYRKFVHGLVNVGKALINTASIKSFSAFIR